MIRSGARYFFIAISTLFIVGCVTPESQKPTPLSDNGISLLYKELRANFDQNSSASDYLKALKTFEKKYSAKWELRYLINLDMGFAYLIAGDELENDAEKSNNYYEKSIREYQKGLDKLSDSSFEGQDTFSNIEITLAQEELCESKYSFIATKLEILDLDDDLNSDYLDQFASIYQSEHCPIYVKAWAAADSILQYDNEENFGRRVRDVKTYLGGGLSEEETIYLTTAVAWAEFTLGNFSESLALYNSIDEESVPYSEHIYDKKALIENTQEFRKNLERLVEIQECTSYWTGVASDSRKEKTLIESADSYIEIHDMIAQGRRETKAVYETLSYSKEKMVTDYNVSPLLFKAQNYAKRLSNEIEDNRVVEYSEFFDLLSESVNFLTKSLDLRIQGYYLKKKDYRGEWEKSLAYMDESRMLYSSALQNALLTIESSENVSCIKENWEFYKERISELEL